MSKKLIEVLERIAISLEKLAECVDTTHPMDQSFNEDSYTYKFSTQQG